MTNLFDLTGKVAIVTGSSRGIGRAIAEALADHGARVVISSRKADACQDVADAINAKHPGHAIVIAANISSKESLQALVDETRRQWGRIDILVCNAASNPYYGPMGGITDDQFRKILDNNVLANHWLIQMAAPGMLERGGGTIINMASVCSSVKGLPNRAIYGTTKAAVIGLTRQVAADFTARGVRCNCICPGTVASPSLVERIEANAAAAGSVEAARAAFIARQPMGRLGTPEEIAAMAVYLASDAATFVTGQALVIDGGITL